MKIESVNMVKSTNKVEIMAMGRSKNRPRMMVPISVEEDTGANITLLKAEMTKDLDCVQMMVTDMHVQGYNGAVEPWLREAFLRFQRGKRSNIEEVYISNRKTSNFTSRDGCMALGIISTGLPYAEV